MRSQPIPVLCALLLLPSFVCAQVPCTPERPIPEQNRTEMKHRAPAATATSTEVRSVSQMIALAGPTITTLAQREQETPLSPDESKVVQLTGDLWLVKLAADDCDIHMELSAPSGKKTDPRMIVEIPQGTVFDGARNKLLAALKQKGISTLKPDQRHEGATTPFLRVTVKGFTFFDSWHYSIKDPQRGHGHGSAKVATLWEIHPVWDLALSQN